MDDIKEFLAKKLTDLVLDPGKININLYSKRPDGQGMQLLDVTVTIEHPDFKSFEVSVTFSLP